MEYLKKFPGWQFFIAVAIAGVLAIINNQYPLPAFKYWLRPILFFYLTYILLPVNIIQTKTELKRIMKLMVGTGLVAGVLGLLGVFFGEGFWFLGRAGGLSIFGVNPLGGNHNAVAEVLIAILPMAFVLYILMRKIQHRGWYLLAILFSMGVILLTFSRSGWLALVIMLLILYFARFSKKFDKRSAILVFVVVAIVVLTFYALIWSQVEEVRGSTSSRWLMTGVAWHNFLDRPIIGNGLNTFNEIVGGTFVYFVEFGDPLDSHGFLQKVMTEMGLLGLFSFISMLGYFGYEYVKAYNRAEKKERLIVLGFIMMFCGVVFFQLFSTSYYIVKMWLPIGVGLVGVKLYSQKD
jgi:O-antigen ligase